MPLLPVRGLGGKFRRLLKQHDAFLQVGRRQAVVVVDLAELQLLAVSEQAGVFAVKSQDNRRFFITGHPEYDPDTLANEYFRDVNKGIDINVPDNYFPNDDPTQPPLVRWRSAAQLFYTNWLNYYVYQTTPYDIRDI